MRRTKIGGGRREKEREKGREAKELRRQNAASPSLLPLACPRASFSRDLRRWSRTGRLAIVAAREARATAERSDAGRRGKGRKRKRLHCDDGTKKGTA
jgi:hypothetical protein